MATRYFTAPIPGDDGRVAHRSSTSKEYSHAVMVKDGAGWGAVTWCSRLDLAKKQLASYHGRDWVQDALIVEVTEVDRATAARLKKGDSPEPEPEPAPAPASEVAAANPTKVIYDSLYAAFDHFNAELFGGRLPPVILVLHRKRNAHGYFWGDRWRARDNADDRLPEIALNPETMGRSVREVLSTLVHEMVHHEQQVFGKPSKAGHNKEWADWMDRVGLTPTSTGLPGGKRTGRKVTHMIVSGGAFDVSYGRFMATGPDFSWFARPEAKVRQKDLSKVKHTCFECGTNVWGKLGINVYCCGSRMEAV